MGEGYNGEKTLARQRVCGKCRSYVTMEKINERQFSCPLCNHKLEAYAHLQSVITATEIAGLVAHNAELKRRSS